MRKLSKNLTVVEKLFYVVTAFGHQAVIVFFVVSGFLVGGSVINYVDDKTISLNYIKIYMIKRFSRMYSVLIPALFVGFILDYCGSNIFMSLYSNAFNVSAMNYDVIEKTTFLNLLGNIFNLQTLIVPTLGSNGPLWSLSYEWFYYLLFISFFMPRYKIITAFTLVCFLLYFNIDLLIYFSIWIIAALSVRFKKSFLKKYVAIFVFVFVFLLSKKITPGISIDIFIALSLILLINSFYCNNNHIEIIQIKKTFILRKINKFLAEFSYSLYLFHFPMIVFIIAVLNYFGINVLFMDFNLKSLIIYLVFIFCLLIYSYFMFLLFENKTNKIKDFFIKYINNCNIEFKRES